MNFCMGESSKFTKILYFSNQELVGKIQKVFYVLLTQYELLHGWKFKIYKNPELFKIKS